MTDQISYRVGRHQAQNVYRHGPGDPPDGSYIGVFFNPETAALVVEALNDRWNVVPQVLYDNLKQLRDEARAEAADLATKLKSAEEHISDLEYALNGDKP